jgi:hypothetical protein
MTSYNQNYKIRTLTLHHKGKYDKIRTLTSHHEGKNNKISTLRPHLNIKTIR